MAISRVKTWGWEILTATDLNAEFNNIINNLTPANIDDYSSSASVMRTTVDPFASDTEVLATDLSGEIARIRHVLNQLIGGTYWYHDPATSIGNIIRDYVESGLLGSDPGASLTMVIPTGVAYVGGVRVVKSSGADLTNTYTASKDTYVDISNAGVITYVAVANGAAAPAVTANSQRLMLVVTNGTEITGVTDLRKTTVGVVKNAELNMTGEEYATSETNTTSLTQVTVTAGDRILILASNLVFWSDGYPTLMTGAITKSGTATMTVIGGSGGQFNISFPTSPGVLNSIGKSTPLIIQVTGNGTLTLTNTSTMSGGSGAAYTTGIYGFFLKKQ
jgi:membrane-bound inhibitor of C-type lysozyme